MDNTVGGYIDSFLNERLLSILSTKENVNLETLPKADSEYGQLLQYDGRYENEKDFKNAFPEFLIFARGLWLKNAIETFDQD